MTFLRAAAAASLALTLLAGCSDDPAPVPKVDPVRTAGAGEGAVSLVAPSGLVEGGGIDQSIDWVKPFEEKTGCQATVRLAGSGQEAYDLMARGGYDGGLVPPEFAGRLFAEKRIAAINTRLVSGFKGLDARFRGLVKKDDATFGVPYVWGANLLAYDPARTSAPGSWGAVFDPAESKDYKGEILWRDSPLTLGDAALYLKARKRSLKIKNPFELTAVQLEAAAELLRKQRPNVRELWREPSTAIEVFTAKDAVVGQGSAYEVDTLTRAGRPLTAASPKEGETAWLDSWTVAAQPAHPNCMYQWLDWTLTADVQAQVASWAGVAPVNEEACGLLRAGFCAAHRVGDRGYLERLNFVTPPMVDCGDGGKCAGWTEWQTAWTTVVGK
ncbi:extracellular solute-binding protein [Actinocorallia longicatena]|uniref:ABC transporter substrate-binding protein n=1 Tax=Actinocorallia longicatena TaxID=111803 RepID=A0ABP6PYR3_9ACTN